MTLHILHISHRLWCLLSALALIMGIADAQSRIDTGNNESEHSHGYFNSTSKKRVKLEPSYAWTLIEPLGLQQPSQIDTMLYNYFRQSVPSEVSDAWTTTGNLGGEGINEIWSERRRVSDFFFRDALYPWMITADKMKFYNTRVPMTLLSFNSSGGKETAQERLKAIFSGNINRRAQIGANVDYLYSKGSYANQASKDFTWGFNGSYMGDRYEFQGFYNHYNLLNKENGGITNDLYIKDPAQLQGGVSSINSKTIPTRLNDAHTRYKGGELYLNNRYKVGYWHEEQINDTTVRRTYIPVSSFIWTMNYTFGKHLFLNGSPGEATNFFDHTYMSTTGTRDVTSWSSLKNTFGISMLEGFHKYAKFGLAAYVTHELESYKQTPDTLTNYIDLGLEPFPDGIQSIAHKKTNNILRVGGLITKQRGSVLTYQAGAEFGLIGPAAGDININGQLTTRIPLRFDTVAVTAFGEFDNRHAPYLMEEYLSNHFIWQQKLPKTRRYRAGGTVSIPRTQTLFNVQVENITNLLFWNESNIPTASNKNVQVLSISLEQNLNAGILHWNNRITYQTTSRDEVLPLPSLTVYSNLYLLFNIATLRVQFGIDCDYYTKFYAPLYQPATMSFHIQRDTKVGNYPFMNLYANMRLDKARFFVMMSHINQGMTGKNYFSMPGYPLNPRRFQIGISVDFAN